MIAWRVERHGVVGSTNELALERVREGLGRGERLEGLVIVAQRQTAGRGQHGRTWESPPGGLYLSAVVEEVPPELRERLALVAGVGAMTALEAVGFPQVELWWPNDVMVAGKKVGGVLCEGVVMGSAWAGVIGIGLNVEMPLEALPASLRARATSLRAQGGEVSMRAAEEAVLAGLGAALEMGLAAVVEQVRRRDGLRHKRVAFQSGEQVVEGVAFGIGDAGELLIAGPRSVEAYTQGTVLSVERRTLRG